MDLVYKDSKGILSFDAPLFQVINNAKSHFFVCHFMQIFGHLKSFIPRRLKGFGGNVPRGTFLHELIFCDKEDKYLLINCYCSQHLLCIFSSI
jgi:hypothetical protein